MDNKFINLLNLKKNLKLRNSKILKKFIFKIVRCVKKKLDMDNKFINLLK